MTVETTISCMYDHICILQLSVCITAMAISLISVIGELAQMVVWDRYPDSPKIPIICFFVANGL